MNMQTFSLFNINFEAFGTVAYKKKSNYIRAWLGNASTPNRNFKINGIVYTVPESGSTYVDFSDIVRSQNSGSVTVEVLVDFITWSWVSLNGVSPYKNIIPPAKMITSGVFAGLQYIPVTLNILGDGFRITPANILEYNEITNNIPLQYFFYRSTNFQYKILDGNDSVFWQSRLQYDTSSCEKLAYLEWESEVGTKKGWIFEILDTQKKTINSTSLQKITNDFDVRKGYELYFRLQTDKFNFQEREYFSDIVISDNIKFKIDGLESEATCVDSAFTNRNDNELSSLIFNIKVKKYGTI